MTSSFFADASSAVALDTARHTTQRLRRRAHRLLGSFQRSEAFYQSLVHEIARHYDFDYIPMPVGAAANYGLLYSIYRVATSINDPCILELGVGQSTIFLDRLSRHHRMQICSLEHDLDWQKRIDEQVKHSVMHAPLRETTLDGKSCRTYTLDALESQHFNVVIVDGPLGSERRSRWGSLEIIEKHLKDDFVVIFDDVDRQGELETAEHVLEQLTREGKKITVRTIVANKTQLILASENYAYLGQLL